MADTRRLLELLRVRHPVVQAPMAGAQDQELAIAVGEAGGLGSLPCALLTPSDVRRMVGQFRQATRAPLNLNFFCHSAPAPDATADAEFRALLAPYYRELGVDARAPGSAPERQPFNREHCGLVEELRPEVVSFHFGLPTPELLRRVRATGATIMASATTVAEARKLTAAGCDVIIAQGAEAGGHRSMFLTSDVAGQVGTFALVPQVVDAVNVPVLAAGGVGDARGVVAALALGASGVQVGTAYLFCIESRISALYRRALTMAHDDETRITNVFTGRPARALRNRLVDELGPLNAAVPAFPLAANSLAPLRAHAERAGLADFSPLWAGQAAALPGQRSARELTLLLARAAGTA
jgi:nitronate monooxygenase